MSSMEQGKICFHAKHHLHEICHIIKRNEWPLTVAPALWNVFPTVRAHFPFNGPIYGNIHIHVFILFWCTHVPHKHNLMQTAESSMHNAALPFSRSCSP